MTPKQEQFCREYLRDLNGLQAAIRAGYSERTAGQAASRLLKNVQVSARLNELMAKRTQKTEIDAQWVLERLAKIASFDVRKLFDDHGNLLPIKQLDDDTAEALSAIDIGEITSGDEFLTQTKKFKAADKIRALELIGRHVAMFTDRIDHTVAAAGVVQILLPDNRRDRTDAS